MAPTDRFFWLRDGLEIADGRLVIAGRDAERLARSHGTPLYVYDLDRIADKVRDLRETLDAAGLDALVRFAVKANHHPDVLEVIRDLGAGIDASSPGEVELALEEGFAPGAISFTGTNLTDRDMQAVIDREVHMNVDLLSQLRRYGRLAPGTAVGLRVNPRAGGAYSGSGETLYSGERPTKFGIYEEQLDEALAIAEEYDLAIDVVHMHVGDGFLDDGLEGFEEAVEVAAEIVGNLVDAGCPIREVNTGGGLGLPQAPGEQPLDLEAYAGILARHLDRLGVTVSCEPGDYLVKDSAVLLCEVVTVEDRLGVVFVGLNAGWNVMPDKFIYGVYAGHRPGPRRGRAGRRGRHHRRAHQRGRRPVRGGAPDARGARGGHRRDDGRRRLPPVDEQHALPAPARAGAVPLPRVAQANARHDFVTRRAEAQRFARAGRWPWHCARHRPRHRAAAPRRALRPAPSARGLPGARTRHEPVDGVAEGARIANGVTFTPAPTPVPRRSPYRSRCRCRVGAGRPRRPRGLRE